MKKSRLVASFVFIWAFLETDFLSAQVLVRISAREWVNQVVEAGGNTWIASSNGAYRVGDNSLVSVLENEQRVNSIVEVDDYPWIGSEEGLCRVDGGRAVPILRDLTDGHKIRRILVSSRGGVWLGSDKGLLRLDGDYNLEDDLFEGRKEEVFAIAEIKEAIWVGTNKNGYRIVGDSPPEPLFDGQIFISDIVEAGNKIWLLTRNPRLQWPGPVLRLEDESLEEVEELQGHKVTSIADIGSEVWIASEQGVFRLAAGRLDPVTVEGRGDDEVVNFIERVRGQNWVGATRRAYYMPGDVFIPIPAMAKDLDIRGIRDVAQKLWMWGPTGAYRFDEDVGLWFRTKNSRSSFVSWVFPSVLRFGGFEVLLGNEMQLEARYDRNGVDPYGGLIEGKFEMILTWERGSSLSSAEEPDPVLLTDMVVQAPLWLNRRYLTVLDQFGNAKKEVRRMLVMPELLVWILAIVLPVVIVGLLRRFRRLAERLRALSKRQRNPEAFNHLDELLSKSIGDLGLSVRSVNCLKNANILTLRDLVRKSAREIRGIKNFGEKSFAELLEKLRELDLQLGMDLPETPPAALEENNCKSSP